MTGPAALAPGVAPHPLTLRERLYLTAHLRTVRGGALRDGDRLAVDAATAAAAAVFVDLDDAIKVAKVVDARDLADLQAAVAVLERIVRAGRRQAAAEGSDVWTAGALARDERALRLLRRVRNAAARAAA